MLFFSGAKIQINHIKFVDLNVQYELQDPKGTEEDIVDSSPSVFIDYKQF